MSVVVLHYATISRVKNGFKRHVVPNAIVRSDVIDFRSNDFYFAGTIGDRIYLGRVKVPRQLLEISRKSKRVIHLQGGYLDSIRESKVQIVDTTFVVNDIIRYKVYAGNVSNWRVDRLIYSGAVFAETVLLNNSEFLIKGFNQDQSKYILSKRSVTNKSIKEDVLLFEQDINGTFLADGAFRIDARSTSLVYTLFYGNRLYVTDPLFNLTMKGHTIDTISHPRIGTAEVKSAGYLTYATPPKIVNRASAVNDGKLYVNSNLMGDNEVVSDFRSVDVIDVYELSSVRYGYSFYVPRKEGQRIRHFIVLENKLYALTDNLLITYQMK